MKKLVLVFSLLVYGAWAVPSIKQVQSIGSLSIGMTESKVKSQFSSPPQLSGESSQSGPDGMIVTHNLVYPKEGVSMIMASSEKTRGNFVLYAIVVKAPYQGKTPQGIGIGSSWEEVDRAYKPLAKTSSPTYVRLGVDEFEAVEFGFRKNLVSGISIGSVGDASATFPPIY